MNEPLKVSLNDSHIGSQNGTVLLKDGLKQRLNLRQLGGLPTADGRRVRADRLFRSGEMTAVSDEELQLLEAFGLAFICDFRTEDKGLEVPTPRVGGTPYLQLPINGANFGAKDIPKLAALILGGSHVENPLPDIYRRFVTDEQTRGTYTRLMRTLLEAEGRPVLWHCTAGKDRTGFAAAVILLALGATEETIVADYLLTAEYRLEVTAKIMGQVQAALPDQRVIDFVRAVLGVQPEYIRGALDEMRRLYGSTDAYLEQGLGVSREEQEQLRCWYLE
ncbi:tyrosine-protein phosphatase [Paenibacillus herberti]|uniref:Tyrosine specific protein phosphatases domain-containing protein n=1 Tax=Paenibacillus herberti TaxID=1619309 RepID=A0A229NX11_9BACL|nr:tyrosine-protein phosphatase [Paenibacillus herberti]OXM14357.1 hypothetical protein CGZ75_15535 [Paenibacillus herberti]